MPYKLPALSSVSPEVGMLTSPSTPSKEWMTLNVQFPPAPGDSSKAAEKANSSVAVGSKEIPCGIHNQLAGVVATTVIAAAEFVKCGFSPRAARARTQLEHHAATALIADTAKSWSTLLGCAAEIPGFVEDHQF